MFNNTNIAKWIIPVSALEAAVTGLVLLVAPSLFAGLILGAELTDAGQAMGRLTGIAMIGAALAAWWPLSAGGSSSAAALPALTIYNLLATIYLANLGIAGQLVGILLWPAVVLHAALLILLAGRWHAAGVK